MSGFYNSLYESWQGAATEMVHIFNGTSGVIDTFVDDGEFQFTEPAVLNRAAIQEVIQRRIPIETEEAAELIDRIKTHIPDADIEGKMAEFMHDSDLFEGRAGTFDYSDPEDLQSILDILDQGTWDAEMNAAELEPSTFVRYGDDWLQRTKIAFDSPLNYEPPEWNPLEAQMGPGGTPLDSGGGGVTFKQWQNTKRFSGTTQIDPGIDPGQDIPDPFMGDTEAHQVLDANQEHVAKMRQSIREFRDKLEKPEAVDEQELDDFLTAEFGDDEAEALEEIADGQMDWQVVDSRPSKMYQDVDIVKLEYGIELQEIQEPTIGEIQDFVDTEFDLGDTAAGDIELQEMRVGLESLDEAAEGLVESGLDLSTWASSAIDVLPSLGETLSFAAGLASGALLGLAGESLVENMIPIVKHMTDTGWIKHPYDIHGMGTAEALEWAEQEKLYRDPSYHVTEAITKFYETTAKYMWVLDNGKASPPASYIDYFGKRQEAGYGHDIMIRRNSAFFKGTGLWIRGRVMSTTGKLAGYRKPFVEFEDDHDLRYSLRLKPGENKFYWVKGDATLLMDTPLTTSLCLRANEALMEKKDPSRVNSYPRFPPKLVNPFSESDKWFLDNTRDYVWDEYNGYYDMAVPNLTQRGEGGAQDPNTVQLRRVYLGLLHGGYWGTPSTNSKQRVGNLHNILDPTAPINAPKKTRFDKWRDKTTKKNAKEEYKKKQDKLQADRDAWKKHLAELYEDPDSPFGTQNDDDFDEGSDPPPDFNQFGGDDESDPPPPPGPHETDVPNFDHTIHEWPQEERRRLPAEDFAKAEKAQKEQIERERNQRLDDKQNKEMTREYYSFQREALGNLIHSLTKIQKGVETAKDFGLDESDWNRILPAVKAFLEHYRPGIEKLDEFYEDQIGSRIPQGQYALEEFKEANDEEIPKNVEDLQLEYRRNDEVRQFILSLAADHAKDASSSAYAWDQDEEDTSEEGSSSVLPLVLMGVLVAAIVFSQ